MRWFVITALLVFPAFADLVSPRLFWTDKDLRKIESADLDGGNLETILEELDDPRGIAVDPAQDKIYWASHEENGAIHWANCDGSEAAIFIGGLSEPADLVLDLENRLLYWAAEAVAESSAGGSPVGSIQVADLDGSREVSTVVSGLDRPYYLALGGDFIYWSYFRSGSIERASIQDGSNRSVVVFGQNRVRDIEIAGEMIYWCDRNSSQIRRRNIDGNGAGQVLYANGILDRPHGLVLDPLTNSMFWTDTETTLIASAKMDGSDVEKTLASDGLGGPWAIDLVRPVTSGDPYEAWKLDHFTDEELENPGAEGTIWGSSADPDRDGFANLLEYAQGTDPRSATNRTGAVEIHGESESQVILRLRIDDPALQVEIEASEDLSLEIWNQDLFGEVGEGVPDPEDPAYQYLSFEAAEFSKLFVRLRVSR